MNVLRKSNTTLVLYPQHPQPDFPQDVEGA